MSEIAGDGVPEVMDDISRVVVIEAARVVELFMRNRQAAAEEAAREASAAGREATRRLSAEAALSRAKLAPTVDERWWERASPESAAAKWAEAKAWQGVDSSFDPYLERINKEAMERWGLPADELGKQKVPADADEKGTPKRGPMTVDEARAVASESAPAWYKVHEGLDAEDMTATARAGESLRLVEDMTQLRDTGRLETDSARDEWFRFAGGVEPEKGEGWQRNPAYFEARREAVEQAWEDGKEARESIGPVPSDLRAMNAPGGRQAGAGGLEPVTEALPVIETEERREKRNQDAVRRAGEEPEKWDSKEARAKRLKALEDDPSVSANLRAGLTLVDRSMAQEGGTVTHGTSGKAAHAARNRGQSKSQEKGPARGL